MSFIRSIIALLFVFIIGGCGSGGGGSTINNRDETTVKNSVTVDGKASFVDGSSGEDVLIYAEDRNGVPLSGMNVQFRDSSNYEMFIVEDPNGVYLPVLKIYPHNSSHWITMYLPEDENAYDIEETLFSSDEGKAIENFRADVKEEIFYKGRFTPEEIDKMDERHLSILKPLQLDKFFTFLSKANDFTDTVRKIYGSEYQEPEFYDVYVLMPTDSWITSDVYWLEPVDVDASVYADEDGDGYTVEIGDCDDDDSLVYPGAVESCGDGIDQNCDGTVDEGCIPNTPINLVVTEISSVRFKIEWQHSFCDECWFEFKVHRPSGSGVHESIVTWYDNSTIINLSSSGSWWKFWVRAINETGESDWAYVSSMFPRN